jgi:hypothetical protein
MLKIMAFLTRREEMETRAFVEYYEEHHVPLILSLAPGPMRYKRNYVVRGDEFNIQDTAIDFDVVVELAFPDRAAYLAWQAHLAAATAGSQLISTDESVFLDRRRTRACVVEERVTAG